MEFLLYKNINIYIYIYLYIFILNFIIQKMDKFEINHFENIHLGKDAVILTCGPSLTEYTKEKVSEVVKLL